MAGNAVEVVTTGRHDPCVGLRATPIAEAMLAIVLMDHYLRHRAQNADVVSPTPDITRRAERSRSAEQTVSDEQVLSSGGGGRHRPGRRDHAHACSRSAIFRSQRAVSRSPATARWARSVKFKGERCRSLELSSFDFARADIGLFSAGGEVSADYAPKAAAAGCVVIDNTSQFRYEDDIPLVVPEVNRARDRAVPAAAASSPIPTARPSRCWWR